MDAAMKKKWKEIQAVEPDADDIHMLQESASLNDGSTMSLDAFKASLEGYGGKIMLRVPKSLHKRLAAEAKMEGVSLNQYAIYKLSR